MKDYKPLLNFLRPLTKRPRYDSSRSMKDPDEMPRVPWRNWLKELTQVLLSIVIKFIKNIGFFGVGRNHGICWQICNEDPWGREWVDSMERWRKCSYIPSRVDCLSQETLDGTYYIYIYSVYNIFLYIRCIFSSARKFLPIFRVRCIQQLFLQTLIIPHDLAWWCRAMEPGL